MLVRGGGKSKISQTLHSTSYIVCGRIYSHMTNVPKPSQPLEAAVILPSVEDKLDL